jgi:hypothetical protein
MRVTRSKWFVPLIAVGMGMVVFAAQSIGGDPGGGLVSLAIMCAFAALILLGGRSETIRGLRGDGRDERFRKIDIHATALAGLAVTIAVIAASIVEFARGRGPGPYGWLAVVGGVTYVVAVIVLRIRG